MNIEKRFKEIVNRAIVRLSSFRAEFFHDKDENSLYAYIYKKSEDFNMGSSVAHVIVNYSTKEVFGSAHRDAPRILSHLKRRVENAIDFIIPVPTFELSFKNEVKDKVAFEYDVAMTTDGVSVVNDFVTEVAKERGKVFETLTLFVNEEMVFLNSKLEKIEGIKFRIPYDLITCTAPSWVSEERRQAIAQKLDNRFDFRNGEYFLLNT